jgi:GNAT superfamily N-acetyltransferase
MADGPSFKEDKMIRLLEESDIHIIVNSFAEANWPKPIALFEQYFKEQIEGKRFVWVVYVTDRLAGYITLKMKSKYQPFLDKNIPEINDFNVLDPYRRQGIGLQLLKAAELKAAETSDVIGLGVGLYEGYGVAQKLYIKQGYVPDGLGITYNCAKVGYGSNVTLDDDLVLWLTKKLK